MTSLIGGMLLLSLIALLGKLGLEIWRLPEKIAAWAQHHGLHAPPVAEQMNLVRRLLYPLDGAFGQKHPLDTHHWQRQVRHFLSGDDAGHSFFMCRCIQPSFDGKNRLDRWLLVYGPTAQHLPTLCIRRFSVLSTPMFGDTQRVRTGNAAVDRRLYISTPGDHQKAKEWIMQGERLSALLNLPHDVCVHTHAQQLSFRMTYRPSIRRLHKFFTGAQGCTRMLLKESLP